MMRYVNCVTAIGILLGLSGAVQAEVPEWMASNRSALDAYFSEQVERVKVNQSLLKIDSLAQWEQQRPMLRQQLADMLGLHPMPDAGPLNAEVVDVLEHETFRVEKLHFQSLPGLYVTANLYIPNELDEPAPTILYLCGHARRMAGARSLGNKVAYQHHPAWFARHGYVCMVIDTIQLGEIQGTHDGTRREGRWWWNSLGYTPAGVETFNAMRALDYLQTRPEVDGERIGVTGRSGGGTGTLWLAALDDRVAVAAPVAGLTELHGHIVGHRLPSACDCNYFPNVYATDYDRIAALIAPRPLMIANTDHDRHFPLPGVVNVHHRVRHVYRLYDAQERLALTITDGIHRDTQRLRIPVFSWMNRFLLGDDPLIERPATPFFHDEDLAVFDELPDDEIVTRIDEHFIARPAVTAPTDVDQWREQRDGFRRALGERTFARWPAQLDEPEAQRVFAVEHDGVRLEAWDVTVQPHIELRMYLLRGTDHEELESASLMLLDEAQWHDFAAGAAVAFGGALGPAGDVPLDELYFAQLETTLTSVPVAYVYLAPRGIGPHRWAPESEGHQLRRVFPLLGQTLDGQRVLDVTRALQFMRGMPLLAHVPISLHARGDMAGVAVYAAIHDQRIDALELQHPPASHFEATELLHVLRFMDMPQAMAMALEHTRIHIDATDVDAWQYTRDVATVIGRGDAMTIRQLNP